MGRPQKEKPNRADGRFKVEKTIGKDRDGKPIKKFFYSRISKEDAKRKADEYLNVKHDERILFSEMAEKWLYNYKDGNVKETTFKGNYERPVQLHLIPWFGRYYMDQINQATIQEFFSEKSKNYSSTQLQKFKLCLNAIFETAIINEYCRKNPCRQLVIRSKKKSKPKRTYTIQQAQEVIKKTTEHENGIYIRILLQMGLRCSELCGLMWEDIDLEHGIMHVKRACVDNNGIPLIDEPKNQKSLRSIPMPQDLIDFLKERRGSGYIVLSVNNKNISPKSFSAKKYKKFFRDTGLPELTPHELRHTCGTLLYNKTHDIYAVSKFLGHSSIAITTKLYVHDSPEALRAALFS